MIDHNHSTTFQELVLQWIGNMFLNIVYHFQALLMARLLSISFFITLATAISKSSWVTWILLYLNANMPASVQTAFVSAPEAPTIFSPIFLKSIPLIKFIFLEWIFKI